MYGKGRVDGPRFDPGFRVGMGMRAYPLPLIKWFCCGSAIHWNDFDLLRDSMETRAMTDELFEFVGLGLVVEWIVCGDGSRNCGVVWLLIQSFLCELECSKLALAGNGLVFLRFV